MIEFIIGGARSGKSAQAEARALAHAGRVVYVATAEALDAEMRERIRLHQARRPLHWGLEEAPVALAAALARHAAVDACLVVDCLTLWLSNLVFKGGAGGQAERGEPVECPLLARETEALLSVLPTLPGRVILVANELGWGLVPMEPLSRFFRDEAGRLNQRVAAIADRVTLVAAGLPLELKA